MILIVFSPILRGGGSHTLISASPIILSSESERENLLAPIPNTIYFVSNTSKLYVYNNGNWLETSYSHPSYTSHQSGLYKISVDGTGHVNGATAVTKSDITGLGIPSQDTTYSVVSTSANGLAPKRDGSTTKFLRGDGTWAVPPDTNTTYSAAGSSLGLVKSGGDVTISDGTITVNDDSHNHTISNVDGLQTALDGKAPSSHGNHVPTVQTADNAKFLRNDNTWQTVTPANIGAAAASHGTHVSFSTTVPAAAGTAAVGSATTVSRSDHVHPAQTTVSGNAGSATKWATSRNINGMTVNGEGDRFNYGTCSTAAATVAKTVACTGFALATGSEITVKFTVTNTASNPTLNVNSTGAKAIYYRGSAIYAIYLAANRTYTFRYNGTQYDLVGDVDTSRSVDSSMSTTSTNPVQNKVVQAAITSAIDSLREEFSNGSW